MTDREKAIVMAYTGICMLQGDKLNEFYKYLAELYGRPVYTHEIVDLDIAEKSKADFVRICHEEHPERKKGKWIYGESEAGNDGYYCSKCGNFVPWKYDEYDIDFIKEFLFCNKCGADMRTPVETARDIVHKAIDNSVWSDTVDAAEMHKVIDDKYAEIRGDTNVDANT